MKISPAQPALRRDLGLAAATLMGLGSILGTGVFVSISIAAEAGGPSVLLATAAAALVAACNALSSAQLAANHPVSGGTYEYGYRWLHSALGFSAGWMFLCAKSASAATAAMGCAGYLLAGIRPDQVGARVPLAMVVVVVLTVVVLCGIRRSATVNAIMVAVTVLALLTFVVAAIPTALHAGRGRWIPFFDPVDAHVSPRAGFLESCALMFVAYTGYGRIATLAEEVRRPRRTIPLAILVTLLISMFLYCLVGFTAIGAAGADTFASAAMERGAPLVTLTRRWGSPLAVRIVALGAITAMLGVLLNLILGLSRVVLAMARRGEMPRSLAAVSESTGAPSAAVILVAAAVLSVVAIGDVKTTWSFSAFTVLIYYAITNLAALRLRQHERLYSPLFAWTGLVACLFLAFWVEPQIWIAGCGLIAAGLVWHIAAKWLRAGRPNSQGP